MTTLRQPEEVLAGIPGWEAAIVEPLHGGLTNRVFKVTAGYTVGVLKIDQGERLAPLNTRQNEGAVQRLVAQIGLAANVLYADTGAYLTEYVPGVVWDRSRLDSDDNLERVAAALRKLHALPLTGRSFDAEIAARSYLARIKNPRTETVTLCMQTISERRLPQNLCCCHNDLVAANIVSAPDLMFLDWEYACDNDPFFDLATIVEHHQLKEEQVRRLLDVYCDGHGQRWRRHLAEIQKLYLALLWLWTAQRSDADPDERDRLTTRMTTSCS